MGMKNYAPGITASEMSLVGPTSGTSSDANAASPELSLVEAPAPPNVEKTEFPPLSLVETSPPPDDAPRATAPASPELRLVEVSQPPTAAEGNRSSRAPALKVVGPSTAAAAALDVRNAPIVEEVHIGDVRYNDTTAVTWNATTPSKPERLAFDPTPRPVPRARRVEARPTRNRMTLVAGVVGSLAVMAAVGLVAMRAENAPAHQLEAAKPPAPVVASAAAAHDVAASTEAADDVAPSTAAAHPEAPLENLASKMQALKAAGNWHLFVIYASEWARKQPGNPDAWRELSLGYLKMRQFRDALDAATKAVQLAPASFLAWQSLGKVNLALQDNAAALTAFEKAGALNDQDVVSLVQAGTLDAKLGRLPEARAAFAKALAASPEDVDALCGAASVAQKEGRLKEAESITQQLKSVDGICRDPDSVESTRVAASVPAKPQATSPARR